MGSAGSTLQADSGPQQRPLLPPASSTSQLSTNPTPTRSSSNTRSLSSRLGRSRTTQSIRSSLAQFRMNDTYSSLERTEAADTNEGNQNLIQPIEERSSEQEDRPLMVVNNSQEQNDPSRRSPPFVLNRQRSRMSRLGTRVLPDAVIQALQGSGEETEWEGEALRRGRAQSRNYYRFLRDPFNQRNSPPDARRQPIRGPFPLGHHEHQLLPETSSPSLETNANTEEHDSWNVTTSQRSARSTRFRQSITTSLQNLFHRPSEARQGASSTGQNQTEAATTDDSDHLLPPLTGLEHRMDAEEPPHELDAVEPETRNVLSPSRITQGMSTIRRLPHGLRSRSTRLIRRGEHPPLSQVLQLAAAAIAAQLSGSAYSAAGNGQPFAGDAFDGSIQNFVQTLQEAASAQAGENIDLNAPDADLPPVNFMRVFQFPNDENGAPITSQAQSHDPALMNADTASRNLDGDRSVTLVLVGVRSMPNTSDGSNSEDGRIGPSLDTLLSLPFLPPTNVMRNGSSGALFRRSDPRSRDHSRRHSMTNFNSSIAEARNRSRTLSSAGAAGVIDGTLSPALTTIQSESPPGPHPPPSTPADMRSGQATPIRRTSSASGINSSPADSTDSPLQAQPHTALAPLTTARQRRRSDSEFARRPELSSGASRRNGVVEPDHPPPSPNAVGRSWLIYVVGTNVSSDHPAFTMPSLFTDNPSYEDMQMLSTLLGPVKPPVASQDDVTSAGGLYRLRLQDSRLLGVPAATAADAEVDDGTEIKINAGERCLICLCDYEVLEEVRQLNKCAHVYHRECIDEVSLRTPHFAKEILD